MNVFPADFYPKKVYQCPCLTYLIKQIFDANIRVSLKILQAV